MLSSEVMRLKDKLEEIQADRMKDQKVIEDLITNIHYIENTHPNNQGENRPPLSQRAVNVVIN